MISLIPPGVHASPTFEALRSKTRRALDNGELGQALRFCDEALALARHDCAEELVDLAVCNRSAVLIGLGRQQEVLGELRQILVHNRSSEIALAAAYNLSRAHLRNKDPKKGLFYAQISLQQSQASQRLEWVLGSHNQIANCLMEECWFEEAAAQYRIALSLEHGTSSLSGALVLANLGYCMMMLERLREGFTYTFEALRAMRRLGGRLHTVWPHQDLCYAFVEIGRYGRARVHGRRALALAEESADPDRIKNALYLLGETERAAGDAEAAYGYFAELQRRFYPDAPEIARLMVAVGMRKMVNLRA